LIFEKWKKYSSSATEKRQEIFKKWIDYLNRINDYSIIKYSIFIDDK